MLHHANQLRKQRKVIDHYTQKQVYAHYDIDKHQILTTSRQIALTQLKQLMTKHVITKLSGTLIDVGCGTGNIIVELLESFHFSLIYGVDLSAEMLRIAQTKVANLVPICDSASNLNQHFSTPTADLLNLHFLFAYVDYHLLINQAATIVHPGGLISICTTTANSFAAIRLVAIRKFARLIKLLFKVNLAAIDNDYCALMPKDLASLSTVIENNNFRIVDSARIHINIKLNTWRETWSFIHDSGWFIEALHHYKINKIKAFSLFVLWKLVHLLTLTNSSLEDEMEVIILTAQKLPEA